MLRTLLLSVLVTLALASSAAASTPAPTLGPTPHRGDCLGFNDPSRGCTYDIGNIDYHLSTHIAHVGDTITATAGFEPAFNWNWSWGAAPPGTSKVSCTPTTDIAGNPAVSGTCTYHVDSATNGWVPGHGQTGFWGQVLNCCNGPYYEADYLAVLSDNEAITGYARDRDANPAVGATVSITGTDKDGGAVDVFATADSNGEYNALVKKGSYTVSASWQGERLCVSSERAYCKQSLTVSPTAAVDFRERTTGRIVGTVLDAKDQPVGNVGVLVKDADGSPAGSAVTKPDGSYVVGLLKAGSYTVGPARDDTEFDPATRSVQIQDREDERADFKLKYLSVSGTVYGTSCSDTACSRDVLSGATIQVDGTSQRGDEVHETGTSDDKGNWTVSVPKGDYTITPAGAGWDPASLPQAVTDNVSGLEFTECLAGAGASGADDIDWTMPDRLISGSTAAWTGAYGLPSGSQVNPTDWTAQVFLTRKGNRYTCDATTRWVWNVTPPPGGTVKSDLTPGCDLKLVVSKLGDYAVTAQEQRLRNGTWTDTNHPVVHHTVKVKDYLIVGLGDSNGSGEGNPPFYFGAHACNRSAASYQFVTALHVETQDPRTSVTFIPAACSGARTEHITDERYLGLPPQVSQVRTLLDSTDGTPRSVDAILLSAGVNNLTFGPIAAYCATRPGKGDCNVSRVKVSYDSDGYADGYKAATHGDRLNTYLARYQSTLSAHLGDLATVLRASVSDGGLGAGAGKVFAASYPDFSHKTVKTVCGADDGYPNWSTRVWRWFEQNDLKLNSTIGRVAGWTAIPSNPKFLGGGYCDDFGHFVSIRTAVTNLNQSGAFHPDASGHLLEAEMTEPPVCTKLTGSPDCKTTP